MSQTTGGTRVTRTPWTASDVARASQMWRNGLTAARIAEILGKSRNAVLGKIGRLGLNRASATDRRAITARPEPRAQRAASARTRMRRPVWDRRNQARLNELWEEGYSTDEIAVRLGCPEALVIDRAARAGLIEREVPERHASPEWFARNDARFRAAMRRALDRGLERLPEDIANGA